MIGVVNKRFDYEDVVLWDPPVNTNYSHFFFSILGSTFVITRLSETIVRLALGSVKLKKSLSSSNDSSLHLGSDRPICVVIVL